MKKYIVDFEKKVWGFAVINAKNEKEAKKKFEANDFDDEFDNQSDYNYGKLIEDK